jgi:hypothetical protein
MKPEQKQSLKSWHRREKETPRQYALFEYFLSLPAPERTSEKVAEKFAISLQYVQRIRSRQCWNNRAFDRDNFVASEIDAKVQNKAEETAFNWLEWEQNNLEQTRKLSGQFFDRCKEMFALPLTETKEEITETTPDGKTIHKTIVTKPIRFTAGDAPKYAEAAIILSRFVLEQSGGTRPAGNIALPKPPKPIDEMTPDERIAYINDLKAAQGAIERGEMPSFDETGGATQ